MPAAARCDKPSILLSKLDSFCPSWTYALMIRRVLFNRDAVLSLCGIATKLYPSIHFLQTLNVRLAQKQRYELTGRAIS